MLVDDFIGIVQEGLWLVLVLAGPPLVVAALAGTLIAFFQATTQLHEHSFQYVAKFFAVAVCLFFMATVLGGALIQFSDRLFTQFPVMIGS